MHQLSFYIVAACHLNKWLFLKRSVNKETLKFIWPEVVGSMF